MAVSSPAASPLSRTEAERLARAVLRAEGAPDVVLSVALVGRRRIRTLNRRYFGRDRETDVIALTMPDARTHGRTAGVGPGGFLVGDVYVCVPVGVAQARRFGATPREELRRLVVHGVLHVLGHDHPSGARRALSPMWRRQERLLARLGGKARP